MEGLSHSLAAAEREAPGTAVLLLAALGLTAALGTGLLQWCLGSSRETHPHNGKEQSFFSYSSLQTVKSLGQDAIT